MFGGKKELLTRQTDAMHIHEEEKIAKLHAHKLHAYCRDWYNVRVIATCPQIGIMYPQSYTLGQRLAGTMCYIAT